MKTVKILAAMACLLSALSSPAQADGVMVFGATGQLGAPHVRQLLEQGETVIAFVRPTSTRSRLKGMAPEFAVGDLMDADSVLAAMQEYRPRVVIDASSAAGNGMITADNTFYDKAMRNIVAAAKTTGVEQIILHGSVGARGSAAKILAEQYAFFDTQSPTMLDKGAAEVTLENSGVGYTIIRNGLLDREPAAATGSAYLTEDTTTFSRVVRADLATLALSCIDNMECMGKIYHAQDDSLSMSRGRQSE
jgi:uncharacterized protein YbjT (DUF2867 family)